MGAVSQRVAKALSSILGALHHDAALAPQLGVVVQRQTPVGGSQLEETAAHAPAHRPHHRLYF